MGSVKNVQEGDGCKACPCMGLFSQLVIPYRHTYIIIMYAV